MSVHREHLYNSRERACGLLERLLERINDLEQFLSLSTDQLKLLEERIRRHFEEFEKSHRKYCDVALIAEDGPYIDIEEQFIDVVSKILGRIRELNGRAISQFHPTQVAANSTTLGPKVIRVAGIPAYDNPYRTAMGIFSGFNAIGNFKKEKETEEILGHCIDTAQNAERQLAGLMTPEEAYQLKWIFDTSLRLPETAMEAWEVHRCSRADRQLPTFQQFLDFLKSRARAKEALSSFYKQQPNASSTRKANKHKLNRFRDQSYAPQPCIMPGCRRVHYLGTCDAFKALNMAQRLLQIRNANICRSCLLPGHFFTNCRRPGCHKCPEAKYKHHVTICPKSIKPISWATMDTI